MDGPDGPTRTWAPESGSIHRLVVCTRAPGPAWSLVPRAYAFASCGRPVGVRLLLRAGHGWEGEGRLEIAAPR